MEKMKISRRRGAIDECIHFVDLVVVDTAGKVLYQKGDAEKYTYFRSSAKPIQALGVILSGAAERFGLSDKELSVICASHFAEDFHISAVKSILAKIGLDESYLKCGAARSISQKIAFQQAMSGIQPSVLHNDCSGKHAGILASCVAKGWDLDTYLEKSHPAQSLNLQIVSRLCRHPETDITLGIDGCGVPVFALPIRNMALGFAAMATGENLDEPTQNAAQKIFQAMSRHPEMVAGTDGFCSALIKATGGRLIAKSGAMGVYAIGFKSEKLGLALKVNCGTPGISAVAAIECLMELKLLSKAEYAALKHFHKPAIKNDANQKVGEILVL